MEEFPMKKQSKRVKAATYMDKLSRLFRCPICHASIQVKNLQSLVCLNNHDFNIAKQGYVNLATKQAKTKYDKQLFQARKEVMQENKFFNPLLQKVSEIIIDHLNDYPETFTVVDMGCGEGSHLSSICKIIQSQTKKELVGIGIDLSKEGIIEATKQERDHIWAVADIANAPFKDEQFAVILNILSPSNYEAFERLLKTNGLLIKVIPQSNYLKELREAFIEKENLKTYSNEKTVNHFQKHFHLNERFRLTYTTILSRQTMESLLHMTPLTWNISKERMDTFLKEINEKKITVDLDILVGVK